MPEEENTLAYAAGISAILAGAIYLYGTFGKNKTSTGTVTVNALDNGAVAPLAAVSSSPQGIQGTADSNGQLVVQSVQFGTYTITVSYNGLANQGILNFTSSPATISIDVDIPNPNFSVVASSGTAITAGVNAEYTVSNAQIPDTVVVLTATARNSLGQTIGIGQQDWGAANGSSRVFVGFNSPIASGSYTFTIYVTLTNGSPIGSPYSFVMTV